MSQNINTLKTEEVDRDLSSLLVVCTGITEQIWDEVLQDFNSINVWLKKKELHDAENPE